MGNLLFFSRKELGVIIAVGLVTGLLDGRIETLEFAVVARIHPVVILNDYLAYVTGGPVFGDLLETWLEFGGVLAACLVRKPGAGTVALTVNGLCQVLVNGTHDPHLLYGVPGLGADVVFALLRYRRYDAWAIALAGISAAMFWYPIVWFTHGIYLYPLAFIAADLALRVLGSAIGDGLVAGAVAIAVYAVARRSWTKPLVQPSAVDLAPSGLPDATGLLAVSLAVLTMVLTRASSAVSGFFLEIGPKIAPGNPMLEEYNPGYAIGVDVIFLVVTMLVLWHLRSRLMPRDDGGDSSRQT